MMLTATVFCGGLALRAVGQVNDWMDRDFLSCPPFLTRHRNLASVQVILTNLLTLPSAAIIGWCQYRWLGAILTGLATWLAHVIFGLVLPANRSFGMLQARLLNPIAHLFLLPYILLLIAVFSLLRA